jgi:hypothetical protein
MDISRYIYLCLLIISFLLSLFAFNKEKRLRFFPFLLGIALITEGITQLIFNSKINFNFIYHIYIPLEYSLWAGYFYLSIDIQKIKKIILFTIPIFIALSVFISFKIVSWHKFPTLQLNIEGILLVIWAVIAIFTIKVQQNKLIFSLPAFWICIGVLIYYTGIASFMSLYNLISAKNTELFIILRLYLLIIPNCILYTCLSIAFICSRRIKK